MHEMKLLMRNYDMEIDIALIHLKNKDIGMDVIVNDLDTLFFSLKARNENENIISSDTVRKILEHYSTVYDENQKRIEKEENINIEYNFREVFLFLLSIDVAMEYEKIHVIRMANI